MNTSPNTPTLLGIVGAGLMGRGIAQIAIQGGIPVLLHDNRAGGAEEAREAIVATLRMLADKGKISAADADAACSRLTIAAVIGELAPCTTIVEAIVEKLDAKKALFDQLEGVVSDSCILATNTSSLSVTEIAAGCRRPGRVAGFHFFSPVPLMKIVEVISGPLTDDGIADTLTEMALQMGHTPVRASDTPGFIVNHPGRGYLTESLRLLGESVADFPEIDRILREAAGFRMGPFELLDLTGLDVSQPVMESIYDQFYQEPRFRPSPIARQRLAARLLGRKTGRGFYRYEDNRKQEPESPPSPHAPTYRFGSRPAMPQPTPPSSRYCIRSAPSSNTANGHRRAPCASCCRSARTRRTPLSPHSSTPRVPSVSTPSSSPGAAR